MSFQSTHKRAEKHVEVEVNVTINAFDVFEWYDANGMNFMDLNDDFIEPAIDAVFALESRISDLDHLQALAEIHKALHQFQLVTLQNVGERVPETPASGTLMPMPHGWESVIIKEASHE